MGINPSFERIIHCFNSASYGHSAPFCIATDDVVFPFLFAEYSGRLNSGLLNCRNGDMWPVVSSCVCPYLNSIFSSQVKNANLSTLFAQRRANPCIFSARKIFTEALDKRVDD